jgi:hypothetical protein
MEMQVIGLGVESGIKGRNPTSTFIKKSLGMEDG